LHCGSDPDFPGRTTVKLLFPAVPPPEYTPDLSLSHLPADHLSAVSHLPHSPRFSPSPKGHLSTVSPLPYIPVLHLPDQLLLGPKLAYRPLPDCFPLSILWNGHTACSRLPYSPEPPDSMYRFHSADPAVRLSEN